LDYAAPEQFQGKTVDARTDVYSLGCVLYECLTGEVPYPQDNQAALVYAHLMGTPPKVTDKLPDLPVAIDRVVAKAMAKNPEDRYPSAGELVQAAAEASRVPAVSPTTPTRPVPPPPHRTSRRALAMAGAALVLAGLVIVIVLAARSSKSAGPSASSLSAGASAPRRPCPTMSPGSTSPPATLSQRSWRGRTPAGSPSAKDPCG
jgi:serine/threonine-protein kinase